MKKKNVLKKMRISTYEMKFEKTKFIQMQIFISNTELNEHSHLQTEQNIENERETPHTQKIYL